MSDFRRARQPEQINHRRDSLLAAARELFDTEGPAGAGLNAIAARAGFTKSNVYRYFESREDVLLALFLAEYDQFSDEANQNILAQPSGDTSMVAEALASCFLRQPRCCQLMSIFATVLEQNVSETRIEAVKRHLAVRTEILVSALTMRLPGATREDCAWAVAMISSLVAGMWPGVRPSSSAAAVMAKPEFAHMLLYAERDLARAIAALLTSIAINSLRDSSKT